jgi:hypothetical protein
MGAAGTPRAPAPTTGPTSLPAYSIRLYASGWLDRHKLRCRYSIAPLVSRAIRVRALICLFRARPSAVKFPCLRAFRLPLEAPPPAPCILQTL